MADYALPDAGLEKCTFKLMHSVSAASIGSGLRYNVTETSSPFWMAEIATQTYGIDETELGQWTALILKLRGGVGGRFLARDHFKDKPLAYWSAAAATDVDAGWDGTAGVSALTAGGSLSLTDLPDGYVVSVGDRIGLEQTVSSVDRYGYHEVISGGTASGLGAVTVTVTPFIKTGIFTTSATARLWKPGAAFIIDPEYDFPQQPVTGSLSFNGVQRV